jgi:hypothetical protein
VPTPQAIAAAPVAAARAPVAPLPGKAPSAPAAAAPAKAPAAAAAAGGASRRVGIKLQLVVVQGRNLVAKDDNGLSDPYVTVKLKTPNGTKVDNDQRQATRYIKETLNPVWCEVFTFSAAPEDMLCIKCWDKDLFGHDIMGVINLPIASVLTKLSAGGASVVEWVPLAAPPDDVKGELQLAFTWLL